ncbi:MAG: hydrogen peroxide-inducible genes activator [Pseudomonadota bacterium]
MTQLEYLLAVNDTKNFSRAAKDCNVSQPSLSAQIQKAEEELGIIIFDRSKKPIITTQKGLQVINQAKNVLKEYRKIFDIKNDTGILRGEFHLGVIPSLASSIIPLFIESFSKKYPQVKLRISEYKTEDMIIALYDDALDGGILVTPLRDDKIIERTLFYEKFFVFASKDHELAKKKTVSDQDLDTRSVWLLEEGHCFRDQVIRVCSLNKRNHVLENVNFASGSLETLINLIRRGRGYTLLPELSTSSLSEDEKANHLRKFKKPVPTREVSLVHSRSFLKQEIIDAIQEEILKNLPANVKSLKKNSFEVIDI